MISKQKILERELKKRWISNFEATNIVFSAHADRRLRAIRANVPAGYKFVTKKKSFKPSNKARTVYFDKYKLVKCK